jgi:transcriptional regulator with XRE-family HTH domain
MPSSAQGPKRLSEQLDSVLRAARRRADVSQRQLAVLAGVPVSTVARLESERGADPRLRTLERCLEAMGLRLAVVTADDDAAELAIDPVDGQLRNAADRRYPAHLDVRPVKVEADWWGAWWGYDIPRRLWPMKPPDHTYDLRRDWRDRRRQRED